MEPQPGLDDDTRYEYELNDDSLALAAAIEESVALHDTLSMIKMQKQHWGLFEDLLNSLRKN